VLGPDLLEQRPRARRFAWVDHSRILLSAARERLLLQESEER
jgi:hypothetical protein